MGLIFLAHALKQTLHHFQKQALISFWQIRMVPELEDVAEVKCLPGTYLGLDLCWNTRK